MTGFAKNILFSRLCVDPVFAEKYNKSITSVNFPGSVGV
jgi:hypothetical protein